MTIQKAKKTIITISVIFIVGIAGFAWANMGFGSHMGGHGGGAYMNNYGNGHHMGSGGYGNGNHMMGNGYGNGWHMNNGGHRYDNNDDYNRMIEDMDRFHNGNRNYNNRDNTQKQSK